MNYVAIKAELDTDPLGRGYSGMTDEQVVADMNTANRDVQKSTMTASEIFESIDVAEWQALTDVQKSQVKQVLDLGDLIQIGPGTKARDFLVDAFGAGTQTRTDLLAAVTETVSRATELGIGSVHLGDVQNARAI